MSLRLCFVIILLFIDWSSCQSSSMISDFMEEDEHFCGRGRQLREYSVSYQTCGTLLSYSEQCNQHNPSQDWLDPCYCGVGFIDSGFYRSLCCQFRNQDVDWTSVDVTCRSVHLFNSSDLQMHVDPYKVHQLYVYNSLNVDITMDRDNFTVSGSTFGAVGSIGRNVPVFETIILSNSGFYLIPPTSGIQSICLVQSSVDYMEYIMIDDGKRNKLMPEESEREHYCFKAEDSRFEKIVNLTLKCSGLLKESEVHEINSLGIEYLHVLNSFIGTIHPEGLTITKYGLTMDNIRIGLLYSGGIVAKPNMTVTLRNVVVDLCDEPCFPIDARILVENVTVNRSPYRRTLGGEFVSTILQDVVISGPFVISDSVCERKLEDVILCKVPDSETEQILFVDKDSQAFHVKVVDHPNLRILEGCQLSIEITNITGSYFPYENLVCDRQFPVKLFNSNLSAFIAVNVDHFMASDSKIYHLNLRTMVRNFTASNVRIGELKNITFLRHTPALFNFFGGSIEVMKDLILHSPAFFSNTFITKIENFKIDYWDTPLRQLTVMINCKIDNVEKHGINVENGTLMLSNVSFNNTPPEMIRIGHGGRVILKDMGSVDFTEHCSKRGPMFSAVFRHQVVLIDDSPTLLDGCIVYRPGPSHLDGQPPIEANYLKPTVDCRYVAESHWHICGATVMKDPIVVGNSTAMNFIRHLHLKDGKNVTLAEYCLNNLDIDGCDVTRVEAYHWTCPYELRVRYSVMSRIVNQVLDVSLDNSKVGSIDLTDGKDCGIKHSNVYRLFLNNFSSVKIFYSNVSDLQKVSFRKEMTLVRSTINNIRKIIVNTGSSLNISDTTINELPKKSISVYGTLTITNVTVKKSSEGGIWIAKEGNVKCSYLDTTLTTLVLSLDIFEWEDPKMRYRNVCTEKAFVYYPHPTVKLISWS